MNTPLTIGGFMNFILMFLGAVLLVFLIFAFKNLSDVLKSVKKLVDDNEKQLKETVDKLPQTVENLEQVTEKADKILEEISPDLSNIAENVSNITDKVGSVSSTVESMALSAQDTIDVVSGSISDTAYAFSSNVNSLDKYITIFLEVLEQIKNFLKKRQ